MKKWIAAFVAVAGLSLSPTALSQGAAGSTEAPFGLQWGAVKENFFGLRKCKPLWGGERCQTIYVPKGLSDAHVYMLWFDRSRGLQRAGYVSKEISGDFYGERGEARYEKLRKALTRKYPDSEKLDYDYLHQERYEDFDQFYECLAHEGCGEKAMFIQPSQGSIRLKLVGLRRGEGRIELAYESPEFRDIISEYQSAQDLADEEAL